MVELFPHVYLRIGTTAIHYPDVFWFFLNGMGAQKNELKEDFAGFFPGCFMEKLNEMFSNISVIKVSSRDTNMLCSPKGIKYRTFSDPQPTP